jgi:hypothetical protein
MKNSVFVSTARPASAFVDRIEASRILSVVRDTITASAIGLGEGIGRIPGWTMDDIPPMGKP